MRRFLILVLIFALTWTGTDQEASAATTFKNCAALNKKYPNGVALNKSKVKKTRAKISSSIYNSNRKLDFNKNGIACEKGDRQKPPTTTVVPLYQPVVTYAPPVTMTVAPTTTTSSTTTTPTTTIPVQGTSRSNPYPFGQSVSRPDGWSIQVVSITPDATSIVLAENMFNDPPGSGGQFFIARIRATFQGAGSSSFGGSFRLRAVGNAGNSYTTFNDSCGVIPNPISDSRTFTGGTVEGNVCWAVSNVDAQSLLMYDEPLLLSSGNIRFFALR